MRVTDVRKQEVSLTAVVEEQSGLSSVSYTSHLCPLIIKYSTEESLVAVRSLDPQHYCSLYWRWECSMQEVASSAASVHQKPVWELRSLLSLSGFLMAASGWVHVDDCWLKCLCVSGWTMSCVLFASWETVRFEQMPFSYVAACWTLWVVLNRTECLYRVWAPRPACTGLTMFLHHSRKKTCWQKNELVRTHLSLTYWRWTFTLQFASPIVPYKLYVMSLVAFFDAVNTDGIPVCCVTGVTPAEKKIWCKKMVYIKHYITINLFNVNSKSLFKRSFPLLPVEVMHWVTGVAGDLVETLSSAHGLLNGILVIEDLIV